MFDDLITLRVVTGERAVKCDGGVEQVFSEGAVMLAFSMYLYESVPGLKHVSIHPDGEHDKVFKIRTWLEQHGFARSRPIGTTNFGGLYTSADGRSILVNPKSGVCDVVADHDGWSAVAECKGGCINSRYSGVKSKMQTGLRETVGQLLEKSQLPGQRQYAVAPWTSTTAALAQKMAPRVATAGIEIVLLDRNGCIVDYGRGRLTEHDPGSVSEFSSEGRHER